MKQYGWVWALACCGLLGTPLQAAEYLFKDQAGSLYFHCGGAHNLSRAKVHYQGYGHYDVEGPYQDTVVQAENAFEAATKACGEFGAEGAKVMLGLKSFKDE